VVNGRSAQRVVDIAEQKIRSRQRHAAPSQRIDQLVDRAGRIQLRIAIDILANYGERFSIEKQFDVGIAPGSRDADLVGTVQQERARVSELNFFQIGRDYLYVGIKSQRDDFLGGQIIRHRLENLAGVVARSLRLRNARKRHRRRRNCESQSYKSPSSRP